LALFQKKFQVTGCDQEVSMRILSCMLLAWISLQGPAMAGGTPPAYSLMDSFKAAEKRSLALAFQQEFVLQAEENYHQAVGNLLPNLSGVASYATQDNSGLSSVGSSFYPPDQRTLQLSASQPLFRGMREYAALTQLQDQIIYQQESKQWAGLQLLADTTQSFYNVLVYETDLAHLDSELSLFDQRIRDLHSRVQIGRSRTTEVLTLQSSQALLKAQREQVLGQLNTAREIYAFLTGLPQSAPLNDTTLVPRDSGSMDGWLSHINERPDIRAGRAQIASAQTNVTISEEAHLPSLDAGANYYFIRSGILQSVKWDVQITLTLPVFMGGILVSKTRQAESSLRQSQQTVNSLENIARETIRATYANLQADLSQVNALEDAVQTAEKNYTANVRDYNLALVNILDVLSALTSYQDALRSLDRARYAAKTDYIRLQIQTAQALPWLEKGEHP
jgi:outer membrane protein